MPEVSSSLSSEVVAPTVTPTCNLCMGCGQPIRDQFIYKVLPDMQWHENCLKCAECDCRLRENSTCFVKNGRAYCKNDYNRLFMVKCDRCTMPIKRNDLVMKAKSKIYHFDCFACSVCSKRLQPGDEYQIKDDLLYCKEDSMLMFGHQYGPMYGPGPSTSTHGQLYLSGLNNYGSSVSMTPENSISSSASSTSSTSFSPNTNSSSSSSSSSSSLMDSPSASYATLNATNTSYHGMAYSTANSSFTPNSSHSSNNFFPTSNLPINGSATIGAALGPTDNNNNHRNDTYDSNEKDDDNSVSNMDDEQEEEEEGEDGEDDLDEEDIDNSISEESSLNESATSVKVKGQNQLHQQHQQQQPHMNKHGLSNMGRSMSGGSGKSLLQLKSHHHMSGHNHHHHHHHHAKPARIRTVLNEKQLHTLRAVYGANPRPDALMKEQLVEMTGLNPRVIRVWFQNKRCKDKKKNMLGPGSASQPQPIPAPNMIPNQPGPPAPNQPPYQFQHFNTHPTNPNLMFDPCY